MTVLDMNLDDPIQGYLPDTVEVPDYNGDEITLAHLSTFRFNSLSSEVNLVAGW